MDTPLRYLRNIGPLTPEENARLKGARVCVIGCGGLGGYLIEFLSRLGVGHITVADGDFFDQTNLNRQLLCTPELINHSKAHAAKERIAEVNPEITVRTVSQFLTRENADSILEGHDLVMDGLDGPGTRLLVQEMCKKSGIPLIHGAAEGWFAQICTIMPGDDSLRKLYPGISGEEPSVSQSTAGVLSFVPAFAASIQASEAVRILLNKEPLLRKKVLFADLLTNHFDILPL